MNDGMGADLWLRAGDIAAMDRRSPSHAAAGASATSAAAGLAREVGAGQAVPRLGAATFARQP